MNPKISKTNVSKLSHYQLFRKIVKHFPLNKQFSWDCSKFFCPKKFWNNEVKRIFIMLDCEYSWYETQTFTKNDFIIMHHPMIFDPTPNQTKMLNNFQAIGVGLLFFHTNFDLHPKGMNNIVANWFSYTEKTLSTNGFWIKLTNPLLLTDIIQVIKQNYLPQQIIYDQSFESKQIQTIQILMGSGASCIDELLKSAKPDLLITGDMKWHDWLKANDLNLVVLDVHHSSEAIFVEYFEKFIKQEVSNSIKIIPMKPQLKLVYLGDKTLA